MANPNPGGGRGQLIGSAAMLFTDQMAIDLYFQDIWHSGGTVYRVAVVCVAWGISIAVVQEANAVQNGYPGNWNSNHLLLHMIDVQDRGLHPLQPPGPLPHIPLGQPLPPIGMYHVNGHITRGYHMPWHHRVEIRRTPPVNQPLHYHQHERRKNHGETPPAIKPEDEGTHKVFHGITFSTQLQNYRRITGVVS